MRRSILFILVSGLILSACSDDSSRTIAVVYDPQTDTPIDNPIDQPAGPLVNQEEVCQPNETACDGFVLKTCGSDGQFVETPCGVNELCAKDGESHRCMSQAEYDRIHSQTGKDCEAGQSKCEAGKRFVCDNEQWSEAEDCLFKGMICDDSGSEAICKTETVIPEVKECISDETRCNGNVFQKCSDEGKFVDRQDCSNIANEDGSKMMCQMQNNEATCVNSCDAGSTRCNGDVLEICNDNGEFEATVCDNPGQRCQTVNGNATCTDPAPEHECEGSVYRCYDNSVQQCENGSFVTRTNCAASGMVCEETSSGFVCATQKCTQGETKCSVGNTLLTCDSAGNWQETKCLLQEPKMICLPNGGANGEAACVEIEVSGSETLDSDGDTIPDTVEGRESNRDTDGDGKPDYQDTDSDGDGIPDSIEAGNDGNLNIPPVDSDYDGIPDYIDTDSDNNGIPDKDEVGSDPLHPLDTDGNKIPDYIDYDNDGDGFSDLEEITGLIATAPAPEAGNYSGKCNGNSKQGTAENPLNCKSGTPADYMNTDSDGDGLSDAFEGLMMKDGLYSRYSVDTDNDGISDYDECVDYKTKKLGSSCRDSDGDGVPDMLELDSDGDGLSDDIEIVLGSNPTTTNTDGDDTPDIVEWAICELDGASCKDISTTAGKKACKCPAMLDKNDSPTSRGDFVFITPYDDTTTPDKQTLAFETAVQSIDIYFSIDQSGSMATEINTLRDKIPSMIETMSCRKLGKTCDENKDCKDLNGGNAICGEEGECIVNPKNGEERNKIEGDSDNPGCFANLWTGVGYWGNINSFHNKLSIQSDPEKTSTALSSKPNLGSSENSIQPPACAVMGTSVCTTDSYPAYPKNCYSGSETRVGCVGYRPGAIKIYIQANDENNVGATNYQLSNANTVGGYLRDKKVRFIGLYGEFNSHTPLENGIKQLACEAGSCPSTNSAGKCSSNCQTISGTELGNLYVTKIDDEDIEPNTIKLVRKLASTMALEITSTAEDIDTNAAKLISKLTVNISEETIDNRKCNKVTGINGTNFQGINKLQPGISVCYDVIPVNKQKVFPAQTTVQVKKARIKVMGDGSVLNSGVAYFVIPPVAEGSNEQFIKPGFRRDFSLNLFIKPGFRRDFFV